MEKTLHSCLEAFKQQIEHVKTPEQLEQIRVEFIGRKGQLAALSKQLKTLAEEERRVVGPLLARTKKEISQLFEEKKKNLSEQKPEKKVHLDVTSYKPGYQPGTLHPYTHITQEVESIFTSMGFAIADGPEIDTDYYNFEALNIPKDHPARDMYDTFWLNVPHMLMRTHTSSVQAHVMEAQKPPIAVAVPGRCFRHEATDASHDFMFLQCEGLVIDKNISISNLLATTQAFMQALFKKKDLSIRVRPGFFPFVEPGIEIDMTCPFCTDGCSTCKKTRWIEMCGAGMVHPNVLKAGNIDPEEYSGFAFGFGLTRLAMLKYGIHDIRLLHENMLSFLKQF